LFVAALLALSPAVHAQANPSSGSPKSRAKFRGAASAERRIPSQYIVVLRDDVQDVDGEAQRLVNQFGGDRAEQHTYHRALKGFSVRMPEALARRMAADPRVLFVEEDQVMSINTTQTGATWGLDRIDQRDLPLNGTYVYTPTGSGVRAYIIDTGILSTHTQFGGRVTSGFTAINDGRGTTDCNGHGTHVSGTVGGSTYGVAKSVTLVPVRVLDCTGSGSTSGVIAGVDFVTSNHTAGQPAVANMSLGGGVSSSLDTAVNNSINDGVTYAVAAGNENTNACNGSPSRVANAITVGSTTSTDARSSFSNFGTCVDIFAPGSSITSAWYTSTTATNTISGTSMATPHVAGVAALYLQGNPGASAATVWAAIRDSATLNHVSNAGTGSPNRLLYSLLTTAPPPPPPPGGSQLLLNPGFESGNVSWTADSGVITNSTGRPARTGSWYAWLNGYGVSNTDFVYQTVTIPSTATSATLTFYIRIDSAETTTTTAFDTLSVTIRNTSNSVLQTLATYSNLNENSTYVLKTFDVTAFRGQTIRVHFNGVEDSSLQTSFVIDDTALNVQ
jgi:subtilisin family serine protease